MMNFSAQQQRPLSKQLRFFKLTTDKKAAQQKSQKSNRLSFNSIPLQYRKLHQTIRQILCDYQYFPKYTKQELNMTQGQRVLKMNGIKIIKQSDCYFIEKYISKQENIINKVFGQKMSENVQKLKLSFVKSYTLTDPRYMLAMLGYSTKQVKYFDYIEIQCYKCPAYGIEIVIYPKRDDLQYLMIDSVCNFDGKNQVSSLIIQKLGDQITQDNDIDPYTLRPKGLKYGPLPQN